MAPQAKKQEASLRLTQHSSSSQSFFTSNNLEGLNRYILMSIEPAVSPFVTRKSGKREKLDDFITLRKGLEQRWIELEETNAFRYRLNVRKQKILQGKFKFLLQLNEERTTLRRPAQIMNSITQPFDEGVFNFNKVMQCEILAECSKPDARSQAPDENLDGIATILINNSPLTKFHSLICPKLRENHPQILTLDAIELAIDFLVGFGNRSYRIGYNSLGAFASVNHLHLHLILVQESLYIENAKIAQLIGNVYQLQDEYPWGGFCFPLFRYEDKQKVCQDLNKLIQHFCLKSIPHNVVWSFSSHQNQELIRIYVFPRAGLSDKHKQFNVAFCELGGYITVGDESIYESLTETILVDKIIESMGKLDKKKLTADIVELYTNRDN